MNLQLRECETESMGIANIRVNGSGPWSYTVIYGTAKQDTIHHYFPNAEEGPWQCKEGRAIPFSKHHHISINFTRITHPLELSYDIVNVEMKQHPTQTSFYDYPVVVNSDVASGSTSQFSNRIPLNLNHPTYRINVRTSEPVDAIQLCLGHTDFKKNMHYDALNDLWFLIFENPNYSHSKSQLIESAIKTTINFSRIDMHLDLTPHKEVTVEYWSEHWNCVRRNSGMSSYVYIE
jgi:hypothetical protein